MNYVYKINSSNVLDASMLVQRSTESAQTTHATYMYSLMYSHFHNNITHSREKNKQASL